MNDFEKYSQSEINLTDVEADKEKEKGEKIIENCLDILNAVLKRNREIDGEKKELITSLQKIFYSYLEKDKISEQEREEIVFATILIFNLMDMDEMAETNKRRGNKYVHYSSKIKEKYGRENLTLFSGILGSEKESEDLFLIENIFLENSVVKEVFESLKLDDESARELVGKNNKGREIEMNVFLEDNLEDIKKTLKEETHSIIIVDINMSDVMNDESWQDLFNTFVSSKHENILIAFEKMNEKTGAIVVLYRKNFSLDMKKTFGDITPLPKNEVLLNGLRNGEQVFYFGKDIERDEDVLSAKEDIISDDEGRKMLRRFFSDAEILERDVADRYFRKKIKTYIENGGDLQSYLEGHEEHYKKFFQEGGVDAEVIVLTRSGLSANEITIRSLLEEFGKDAKAYYQSGWYYENVDSINNNFLKAKSHDEAEVIFLNKNSAYSNESEKYFQIQDEIISDLFFRAKENNDKKYALVIDVTTDMLDDLIQKFGQLPENITLIKTFSITKHQRGWRNDFFGGVAVWNNDDLGRKLEDNLDKVGGRLLEMGIINYPRLRKSEIEKNKDHLKEVTNAFLEGVRSELGENFEKEGLEIFAYNYYTYVNISLSRESFSNLMKQITGFNIEEGDSFGLEKTRICLVPKAMDGKSLVLRISFGLNSTKDEAENIAKKLAEEYKKMMVSP